MSRIDEKRLVAASEIARLRRRVEGGVGRPLAVYRWRRPIAAALGGLALAMAVRGALAALERRARAERADRDSLAP